MRVLDLFCGAGGAAMGLHRAWPDAEIVGVDIAPQPRYPFRFIQGGWDSIDPTDFDFVWASPPCQRHSRLNGINQREYLDCISAVRQALKRSGVPFVIENVVGAPLVNPAVLCGSMYGLGVWRHRIFEPHGFSIRELECRHEAHPEPLDVTGTGGPCASRKTAGGGLHRKPKNMKQASEAMGIGWMTRKELVQAIPPAYSEYIARQFELAKEG